MRSPPVLSPFPSIVSRLLSDWCLYWVLHFQWSHQQCGQSVAKIIPEKKLGTAYALTFWGTELGFDGCADADRRSLDKYCITGTMHKMVDVKNRVITLYNYSIPMLIFACFGMLGHRFRVSFLKAEDRKKGYGLELPNVKKS